LSLNPDLQAVRMKLWTLLSAVPQQQGPVDLKSVRYETVRLSYVHADRVIALLKALGYSTVEYQQLQGETNYDRVYNPIATPDRKLPVILKMIDPSKTSLQDAAPAGSAAAPAYAASTAAGANPSSVPDIGGSFLHQLTGGDPLQRLLIAYDEDDPESLDTLLRMIREKIDLPSRQIVIEALVIEVNTDRMRELGLDYGGFKYEWGVKSFDFSDARDAAGNATGQRPFTFTFDSNTKTYDGEYFRSSIKALLERGEAEVLASPSVLVLNDRQARIQVVQQVPVKATTTTTSYTATSATYFPVGIVLNLRPRISEDETQVTMQVETIISALSSPRIDPPAVDNRQVQTFVRVANNTPFIIGGLISHDKTTKSQGVPFLSQIPILGAPFQKQVVTQKKREVIVVLTPHIVPQDAESFSFVIPKDSDRFDSFENQLFQSSYRIRSTDVFDLTFLRESTVLKDLIDRISTRSLVDPTIKGSPLIAPLLKGQVPGEEIMVHRMLWELVRKLRNWEVLDLTRILFFRKESTRPGDVSFNIAWVEKQLTAMREHKKNTLVLVYNAEEMSTPEHPFVQPTATVIEEDLPEELGVRRPKYEAMLHAYNDRDSTGKALHWAIVLRRESDLTMLKQCLILKHLMELNAPSGLDLASFHVGRQILFPTREALENRFHIADREAAQLFYQVQFYYPAFEQEFNHRTKQIVEAIGR
jgi:general secretion pathway protein D